MKSFFFSVIFVYDFKYRHETKHGPLGIFFPMFGSSDPTGRPGAVLDVFVNGLLQFFY
jgi:hypothetical protein